MKTKSPSLKQAYDSIDKEILQHVRTKKQTLKQELIAITKSYNQQIDQLDKCLNTIELHLLGPKKKTRKKKQ